MDASLLLKREAEERFFFDRLPVATSRAFLYCADLPLFIKSSWYLAGGTALALQAGHRQSVDLDFFTPRASFQETDLERKLLKTTLWHTSLRREGTLYGTLAGAKMSFIAYPFFRPAKPKIGFGKLRILAPEDIAAMKIIAISQRGRKRDFADLYWYCVNREPLELVISHAVAQYPDQDHNLPHFFKSLTYFEDAEGDPMPRLFFDATWNGIKKFFRREVPVVARKLMRLG